MSATATDIPDPPRQGLRVALGILAALVAWELLARVMEGSFLLAGPVAIVAYLADNAGLMMRALGVTLWSASLGFVFGNLAAIALAALAILIPRLEGTIATLALVVFCLPLVATGPILRVLYGSGIGPQVTLAAVACYYTTFVPLLVGLRAAPASWFDLVASYGRGGWSKLVHVRAMASVPYLIAGLQIAAPAAFLGAMIGEFTGAERGMGVLAIRAMRALDVDATWALATIASAVAICVYLAVGALGRWLWPDRPALILASAAETSRSGPGDRLLTTVLSIGVILALWYGLMEAFDLNRFFAKRPDDVWTYLVTAPNAGQHSAQLFGALSETLVYTLPGYLAGLLLGAALAAAFVMWPVMAGVALPIAIALFTTSPSGSV